MARKGIAAFVVVSWVVLSAIDLLQYADLAIHSNGYSAKASAATDLGRSTRIVNNAIENKSSQIEGVEFGIVAFPARKNGRFRLGRRQTKAGLETDAPETNRKIYKLHRAFLI